MSAQPILPLDGWINAAISQQLPQARRSFSLDDAVVLADFARYEAQACGVPMVFSLVDGSGNPSYFFSMDDALLVSHSLACQKAWTAVALKMATQELANRYSPAAISSGCNTRKEYAASAAACRAGRMAYCSVRSASAAALLNRI